MNGHKKSKIVNLQTFISYNNNFSPKNNRPTNTPRFKVGPTAVGTRLYNPEAI